MHNVVFNPTFKYTVLNILNTGKATQLKSYILCVSAPVFSGLGIWHESNQTVTLEKGRKGQEIPGHSI